MNLAEQMDRKQMAAEICATWEATIKDKGGHARDQQCCLLAFFIATKMKLSIPMRMCYVYAVVPQPCFIGQKTETVK